MPEAAAPAPSLPGTLCGGLGSWLAQGVLVPLVRLWFAAGVSQNKLGLMKLELSGKNKSGLHGWAHLQFLKALSDV